MHSAWFANEVSDDVCCHDVVLIISNPIKKRVPFCRVTLARRILQLLRGCRGSGTRSVGHVGEVVGSELCRDAYPCVTCVSHAAIPLHERLAVVTVVPHEHPVTRKFASATSLEFRDLPARACMFKPNIHHRLLLLHDASETEQACKRSRGQPL